MIETCKHTLRNLQLDYLDLYLVSVLDLGNFFYPYYFYLIFRKMHISQNISSMTTGVGDSDTTITLEKTWNAMEELVSMGLVKSIGIRYI